jgi:hypothetical protein
VQFNNHLAEPVYLTRTTKNYEDAEWRVLEIKDSLVTVKIIDKEYKIIYDVFKNQSVLGSLCNFTFQHYKNVIVEKKDLKVLLRFSIEFGVKQLQEFVLKYIKKYYSNTIK